MPGRAVSANVDAKSKKSRRAREVPLPDQAAGALDRLSHRGDFTASDDYVFVNRLGRRSAACFYPLYIVLCFLYTSLRSFPPGGSRVRTREQRSSHGQR